VRLYLAGPMTGHPAHNFPAFHAAEDLLRERGYVVLSPAGNEPYPGPDHWAGYMRTALAQLLQADGVCALDGWALSAGASLEVHVAQTLRMPVLNLAGWARRAALVRA
jgi:nucleoside 2-deoxyribosyltransferase